MLANAVVGFLLLAGSPGLVDDAKYASVLSKHVREGRVDYAALKNDRSDLDGYLADVASVSAAEFADASADAQLAYLINAYNAYTLESIIDHYPIEGGWFGRGANSIKGIAGVFDRRTHRTALGKVTLDFIEHETLRKKYSRPAIHMALVCASIGCPPLRGEPFDAETLPEQLEDQARVYLASPSGLRVGKGRVEVSMIFKWFGSDFDKAGGWEKWVSARVPAEKRERVSKALEAEDYEWLAYDWSLNDHRGSSSK